MKPHDPFLALAATSIDFPLAPADRGRLDQHLAGCPACRRTASSLREDARALRSLPPVFLPERRSAAILEAALRPSAGLHPTRIVLVAALLGLLLVGSIAAGAAILRYLADQEDLAVVLPVPTLSPSPGTEPSTSPGPSPSPGPPASPDPSAAPVVLYDTPTGVLAVTRSEAGKDWIELARMDGTVTRLAEGRDPAWLTADRIVYTCAAEAEMPTGICAIDAREGAVPELLVAGADRPAPAPDGRLIAFHRGMTDVGETWVMGADGSNPSLVHAGDFNAWSPDGAWLAGQPESAAYEVAVVGVDGAGFQVLASGKDPSWSPAGDRITYAAFDGQAPSIRSIAVADGEVQLLATAPADAGLSAPTWISEGRLLYLRDGDLWMIDSGQTRNLQVTDGLAIPGEAGSRPLAVSPDGDWVASTTGAGDGASVRLVTFDGTVERSAPWRANGTQPAWAPAAASVPPAEPAPSAGTARVGDTWADAQLPIAVGRPVGVVEAVTAGGPGFVAVGRGCRDTGGDLPTCEGIVWTSADGRAWDRAPAQDALDIGAFFSTSGPEIGMFDVAAGTPGIVAVGYAARPDMSATAWFSGDGGRTWERVTLGDIGTTRVEAVTWDGTRFVVVGVDRSDWDRTAEGIARANARAAVWTSTDGRTFTRIPDAPVFDAGGFVDTTEDPMTGGMRDVVVGRTGLVAVGSTCTGKLPVCKPAAWVSGDGATWERATAMHETGDQADYAPLTSVAVLDGRYVAVDGDNVLVSDDGRTWRRTAQMGIREVAIVGDRFFGTTMEPVRVFPSEDGANWDVSQWDEWQSDSTNEAADWHFASVPGTAVAIGSSAENGPRARVSFGE